MKKFIYLLILTTLSFSYNANADDQKQTVIMIGIDGLRNDSIDRIEAPNLRKLAKSGVRADGMRPAMPSKTFVNFYSLATGLHPKHHGMTSNYPYDHKLRRAFSRATDTRDPAWWGGEPIWITAEKQGVKAGTYFWVGSEVAIGGIQPTYWKPFDQNKDYGERVDEVLSWLAKPEADRPRLITLYFSAVDTAAHNFSVGSKEEEEAVKLVDSHVGDLINGLRQQGTLENTNIIVVADHGMANLSDDRMINLDNYADISGYIVPDWNKSYGPAYSPFLYVYGDNDDIDTLATKLKGKHPNMKVWKKGEFPEEYHFDHPTRGPDLMILADTGWTLFASENKADPTPLSKLPFPLAATHGYDNHNPLMYATFIGNGPSFKKGIITPVFDNVEIYGLIACLLDIKPANTEGNITNVAGFLNKSCSPH
ncbi:alkaline phosphatase family protein [Kordiimonas sp. SCSIO 12603]|uniref:alkaline phosphatase family protein n=1 Tax=Kordiimonas sp. SCSIO 12603 TaxID=2829596 RepID=UPI002105865C|nr:alkaline phosphatase family protein [Kordiimonas sp. SCSIO 12603]UTW58392.1 alkaline phosphatase family protein [Kordiimonas sp. SCSIO 12603]